MTRRKRDTVKRDLLVELTDDERLVLSATQAQLLNEQDIADEEHAARAKAHREAKKERLNKTRAITRAIRTGKTEREVECYWTIDGSESLLIRHDTGDVIERHLATEQERQERLEGVS
jgi:hypothetical protein